MKIFISACLVWLCMACSFSNPERDKLFQKTLDHSTVLLTDENGHKFMEISKFHEAEPMYSPLYYHYAVTWDSLSKKTLAALDELKYVSSSKRISKRLKDALDTFSSGCIWINKNCKRDNAVFDVDFSSIVSDNDISNSLKYSILASKVSSIRNELTRILWNMMIGNRDSFNYPYVMVNSDCDRITLGEPFHADLFLFRYDGIRTIKLVINECLLNGNKIALPGNSYIHDIFGSIYLNPKQRGKYKLKGLMIKENPGFYSQAYPFEKEFEVR